MFLGGVMNATGNQPPGMIQAKAKYMSADVPRCAARYGLEFGFNPFFPLKTLTLLRASLGMGADEFATFRDACWSHIWGPEGHKNLGDPEEIKAMCAKIGMDGDRVLAMGKDDALKAKLAANTEEAVKRGAFGAPTYFVGEDMFFGHDRLDYVEDLVG